MTLGNAGHVYGIANNLNSSRSQTFTYDQVNRILSAGTTATTGSYCWGYQYSYDARGNLLSQAGWSPTYNSCMESTMGAVTADGNNHISAMSYDASGNAQSDGVFSYSWDGESQMKTAGGVTYAYDGDGRRAAKVGSKLYWYGSGGEILSETDAAGNTLNEYVYFGGRRVALVPASGAALYYAEDLLGSSRVMVQSNGTPCYDADFTPFGGERAYTSTCAQNYKFEGKERDTETGNDDFGAREYSWRFGRWLSSDWSSVPVAVPYANLTNPQTLNLYSMVGDDPESFADLDGHQQIKPCHSNNGVSCDQVGTVDDGGQSSPDYVPASYLAQVQEGQEALQQRAQNQSTAPVPNTQAQQIPGTPFTITNFTGALFGNGQYGVEIGATCSNCTDWVQTITRTGAGDTYGREFVDNGNTATNQLTHYSNPVYGSGNHFSDMPTAPNGGSFKAVVWAGSADATNKTFTAHAAFAYGFSVSKSGKLAAAPAPRAATKAERAHSLATIRADALTWKIN